MLFILGQPSEFGDAYDIDLMLLVKSSRLINYFPNPLSTFDQIGLAIYVQQLKLKGKYDALIGDATTNENLQLWKFGKNTGVQSSTHQSPEGKKGFFQSFFCNIFGNYFKKISIKKLTLLDYKCFKNSIKYDWIFFFTY